MNKKENLNLSKYLLFDEHGRCIPDKVSSDVYKESRRYFLVPRVKVKIENIYNNIKNHLDPKTDLSLKYFKNRTLKILNELNSDPLSQNITKGMGVPFFLPKSETRDVGKELINKYIAALEKSFKEENPKYEFNNFCTEDLTNKLKVVQDSRHQILIDAMENDNIVGYYFPCLLEYSVPAAIERIKSLPKNFLLAGAFDTFSAFIGTPNLLLRHDGYPPLLWMTGIEGEKDYAGYHIEAYGYNLNFNRRPHHGNAAEYWAHGLVVLG